MTLMKEIFKPKNRDLLKRIMFTFACLFIFKLGTSIIVPGIDKEAIGAKGLGFLELLNVMGGGAMEKFSIFALGVMPYITASIITQFLQLDIIPYFSELAKQGQVGRNKLNAITRVMGIFLAFLQGYIYSFTYVGNGSVLDYMQFALILTAGTSLLLWIGDQITMKGVGNGISLIIMAGIVASMPNMFATAFNALLDTSTTQKELLGIILFVFFVVVYLGIIIGIIFEENAERRIPIQYANRTNSGFGGKQNYIPFKLNSSGVMPVIFASALITIPTVLSALLKKDGFTLFVQKWLSMTSPTGFIIYVVSIIGFTYFYTFYVQLKPKELADNLNQSGGYIPGIRPGEETSNYITKVLKRITTVGGIFLSFLAALPILFGMFTSLPTTVTIGGTGLLIVVGVALETYKQIQSQLATRSYKRGRR